MPKNGSSHYIPAFSLFVTGLNTSIPYFIFCTEHKGWGYTALVQSKRLKPSLSWVNRIQKHILLKYFLYLSRRSPFTCPSIFWIPPVQVYFVKEYARNRFVLRIHEPSSRSKMWGDMEIINEKFRKNRYFKFWFGIQ